MRVMCILAILMMTIFHTHAQNTEFGLASIYSDEYQNSIMSSGEPYKPELHTAAHKSLPLGSIVKVTNMVNKRTVMVKITDRGPFIKGYVVELSRAASEALRIEGKKGKVKLQVEKMGDAVDLLTDNSYEKEVENDPFSEVGKKVEEKEKEGKPEVSTAQTEGENEEKSSKAKEERVAAVTPKELPEEFSTKGVEKNEVELKQSVKDIISTPADPRLAPLKTKGYKMLDLYKVSTFDPQKGGYGVQVGVFSELHNVLKEIAKLQENWFRNIILTREKDGDGFKYKIMIGPFEERASAANYQKDASKKGAKGFVVAVQPRKGLEIYQVKALRLEDKGYAVQVMNLTDAENLVLEVDKLRKKWYKNILVDVVKGKDGQPNYKIYLGPFPEKKVADSYTVALKKKGIKGFVVDLNK